MSVLAFAGAVLLGPAPARASRAVSIDVGRIDVTDALAPGGQYRLPAFGVANPGSERASYRIVVSYAEGETAARPGDAWFSFSPATFTLTAGERAVVQAHITLPGDAAPGDYAALIGPALVAEGGGAQVGAGAVARLTFTVAPSSPLDAFLGWLAQALGERPWLLAAAAILTLVGAWLALRRRYSIHVSRRP